MNDSALNPDPIDPLGKAIVEGRDLAAYMWQVPTDVEPRQRMTGVLRTIQAESMKQGRREIPRICDELMRAAKTSPSPQQVDLLQDGFDRLYRLWGLARSGLL